MHHKVNSALYAVNNLGTVGINNIVSGFKLLSNTSHKCIYEFLAFQSDIKISLRCNETSFSSEVEIQKKK